MSELTPRELMEMSVEELEARLSESVEQRIARQATEVHRNQAKEAGQQIAQDLRERCSNERCAGKFAHTGPCFPPATPDDKPQGAVPGGWKPPDGSNRREMTEEEIKIRKRIELSKWWEVQAQHEIDGVIDKAIEYGAADLKIMGKAMECLVIGKGSFKEGEIPDRVGMEIATAFYALGKVARLFGAYERGEMPSDDCWADLGIYCRMAQHIREKGRWP